MTHSTAVILIILVLVIVLLMAACQQSSVITSLEAAIAAAEVAIPIIGQATGLPAQTQAEIVTYLQSVSVATSQAAAILANTTLTSAQKQAQILAAFLKVESGISLPAGTPSEIQAVIRGVVSAIATFLETLHGVAPPVVKVTVAAKTKLTALKSRADVNLAKTLALAKK